jgi:hypothetical protein
MNEAPIPTEEPLMTALQIAIRHFGREAVTSLARKGIRVLGPTAIPDERGSFLNSSTAYKVDDNGCGRIWSYREVVEAASHIQENTCYCGAYDICRYGCSPGEAS